ncbi:MAG: CBS domain-containing protein [Ginsengibacter sp.]
MTTLQLADNLYPSLHMDDSIGHALQLMNEFKTTHLPVVADDKFLGVIGEDDLMNEKNRKTKLEVYQTNFLPAAVNADLYFLKAASISNLYPTNFIAVVNDKNDFIGTISSKSLSLALGNFSGTSEFGAVIVLEMERTRFALSSLNSIIESDGATILHMNVSMHSGADDLWEVTLQINKKEVATIVATFERYEYSVIYYSGEELFENEATINYNNLMNYLAI